MKRLSLLIKPASSLCNMRCRYCFYHDIGEHRQIPSYGIMKKETIRAVAANLAKDLEGGDEVTIAFQGGEPTLAGLSWFEDFTAATEAALSPRGEIAINYALQTNGLMLDESWAAFLKKNHFLVGLSLDASERLHDQNRLDAGGGGTFRACRERKALLEQHGVEYNVLCVLTNELAKDPARVWRFIIEHKIRFIQFIPCLEGLDGKEPARGNAAAPAAPAPALGLRPARFAAFFSGLYSFWVEELAKGRYISVKLFDDTANFFFRGLPSSCGIDGRCHAQYVVEADGSVYPCDFYVLDEYNTGSLAERTLRELFDSPRMRAFLAEDRRLPALCGACPYRRRCGGGCRRMRDAVYYGKDGKVCGYRQFLDKCLKPLEYAVGKYFS